MNVNKIPRNAKGQLNVSEGKKKVSVNIMQLLGQGLLNSLHLDWDQEVEL